MYQGSILTVTAAGMASCGYVLAETWTTAALDGNFSRKQTSSGAAANINGARCIGDARGGWGSLSNCKESLYVNTRLMS